MGGEESSCGTSSEEAGIGERSPCSCGSVDVGTASASVDGRCCGSEGLVLMLDLDFVAS